MSQPFGIKAAPQNGTEQDENATDHHQKFPQLAHFEKVARIARRHKVEGRWQCSSEIITKHSAFPKQRRRTKSGAHFGNWRGNIITMSPRIKMPSRKSLSRSTRLTKC